MSKPRIPKSTRAKAAAKVIVDGQDHSSTARQLGVSRMTVARAVEEAETEPDLGAYVQAYRARAVPKWLKIVDKAARQAKRALKGAEARDAAFVAKTFSEMAQRGAGEADVKHEHSGDLEGARDRLAARLAAVAGSRDAGGAPS